MDCGAGEKGVELDINPSGLYIALQIYKTYRAQGSWCQTGAECHPAMTTARLNVPLSHVK